MADNSGKKILLVEDDQFLRDFYQELLNSEGFAVDTAADGEVALEKIRQGEWNLVLLDIMLPKKDGLHILQDLKVQGPSKPIGPIVVLTNLGHDAVINQAFTLGASGYLIKSALSPDQVLTEIKSFLTKPA